MSVLYEDNDFFPSIFGLVTPQILRIKGMSLDNTIQKQQQTGT